MLTQNFLNLQSVQLKAPQEWMQNGGHLSFIFPKAGAGKWGSGAAAQRLGPGDVFVLNITSGGKVAAANQGALDFCCFSLHLEHLFPLFESSEICLLQNIIEGFKAPKFYPAASTLAQECHRRLAEIPAQINLDHRSHLLRVAAAILTVEFNTAKTARAGFVRPEEHLMQVFEKLTAVELLGLSVGELANKFGCSRRHLNRLFHHYFGKSVATLRMEMRLLKSITLLRDPDAKVIRVAEDCGFNQLGFFNTLFKRRFGASPGRWRKLNQKSKTDPICLDPIAESCPLGVNGLCPMTGNGWHGVVASARGDLLTEKKGSERMERSASPTKLPNQNVKREKPATAGRRRVHEETQGRIVIRINP